MSTTRHEGHDQTGTVHVTVDAAGEVAEVALDRHWSDAIDRRRLGPAVLEAVTSAYLARLSAWADQAAAPLEPAPTPRGEVAVPGRLDPTPGLLHDVLRLLDRVDEEQAAAAAPARVCGASAGGHVRVWVDGAAAVVDVRIELATTWIRTANHREIASELRSACRAAYAARKTTAGESGALSELTALTADPDEFVARMFGLRHH